jgi:hypothetical protein
MPEGGAAPHVASTGETTSFSIRGEDAVRLFQEMDRSDRELYGE